MVCLFGVYHGDENGQSLIDRPEVISYEHSRAFCFRWLSLNPICRVISIGIGDIAVVIPPYICRNMYQIHRMN